MINSQNHFENAATSCFHHSPPGGVGTIGNTTAAVIGPMGGTLQVTDPGNPLFGTTLRIPAGALETHTLIQIAQGEHACPFGISPSVKITPEGLSFKRPAEIEMCVPRDSVNAEEVSPTFYVYNEAGTDWVATDGRVLELQRGVFRCSVWQL